MFFSVNCVEFRNICNKEKVTGYPSIIGYNTVTKGNTINTMLSTIPLIYIITTDTTMPLSY